MVLMSFSEQASRIFSQGCGRGVSDDGMLATPVACSVVCRTGEEEWEEGEGGREMYTVRVGAM